MCYYVRTFFICGHFEWSEEVQRCQTLCGLAGSTTESFREAYLDLYFNGGSDLDFIYADSPFQTLPIPMKSGHWHLDCLVDGDCTFCSRMSVQAGDEYSSRSALQAENLLDFPVLEPQARYSGSIPADVNISSPFACKNSDCRLPNGHSTPHLYQYRCRDLDCVLRFGHTSRHQYRRSSHQVGDGISYTPFTPQASITQFSCVRAGCKLPLGHSLPHQDLDACSEPNCVLLQGHSIAHVYWSICSTPNCTRHSGHDGPHTTPSWSSWITQKLYEAEKEKAHYLRLLDDMVFRAMNGPSVVSRTGFGTREQPLLVPGVTPGRMPIDITFNTTMTEFGLASYSELDTSCRQIRLLKLYPSTDMSGVRGSFCYVELSHHPKYIALSYTWGEEANCREIKISNRKILVRENLWWFLRLQSCSISEPKLFWIDAICINQSDISERSHQVGMMRQIYASAANVYIWLGTDSDDSAVALEYITKKASRALRAKGLGFRPVWSEREGKALRELCERTYWRRMWIIQEVINAKHITVWCGTRNFEWELFEKLYQKLKILESTSWLAHHAFATAVFQSSAGVIIWQRAYWRHPDTPTPNLQTLIEVFHGWQCADLRDKVYALVGMASPETAVTPDYSKSTHEVFCDVWKKSPKKSAQFNDMLLQMLALSTDL